MMLTMTLHSIDSFFPSAIYKSTEKQQDRSEPRVLLIIPSAKTIGIIFFKRVVLSSYESYNLFVVFNIEFKDRFTLKKMNPDTLHHISHNKAYVDIQYVKITNFFFLPSKGKK